MKAYIYTHWGGITAAPGRRAAELLNFAFVVTDGGLRLRDVSIFLTN